MISIPLKIIKYVEYVNGEYIAKPNMPKRLMPEFERFKKTMDEYKNNPSDRKY